MENSETTPPLTISGPPNRLELLSPLTIQDPCIELTCDQAILDLDPGMTLPCKLKKFKPDTPAQIKIKLPKMTPPGSYNATLCADGKRLPVKLEIQAQSKLKHYPSTLFFSAAPGGKIEQAISFENQGNTEITIPKEAIANIYNNTAIPEAVANTLQFKADAPNLLLNHLLEKLQAGYGGVMKFHFVAENSTLKPNDKRQFQLSTRLPKDVISGNRYFGLLHVNEFHLLMTVAVI